LITATKNTAQPRQHTNTGYQWIRRFAPKDRLLTGKSYLAAKRIMDMVITLLALPAWGPLMLVIGLLIKITSPGAPALFTQTRTGLGGRRFQMYKFRSMVPNAEALKQEYAHLNELQWPDFKITNDPRITILGKFLRKTSLDELPQLLNVLKGEMSLVGPRPTSFSANAYKLWHTTRLDVPPGITGLWQIYGRASLEFDDRLRLDIAYVERRGLWLDICLLFMTIIAVIEQRGAH
jgi:lipopolysaccharide/colanic/teichoic acid biosynthesis glycosyltransferase